MDDVGSEKRAEQQAQDHQADPAQAPGTPLRVSQWRPLWAMIIPPSDGVRPVATDLPLPQRRAEPQTLETEVLAIACDVLVCFVGYNDPYGLTVAGQANRVLRAAVCRYWDEQEAAETTEEDLDDPLWVLIEWGWSPVNDP